MKKKTKVNRGPVAEIDLSALAHNLKVVSSITKQKNIIAVVKADAYGHGSVEISKRILNEGISSLAVAYTQEAKTLREAGITAKIIVLFDCRDMDDYFTYDLVPVIYSIHNAIAFSKKAESMDRKIPVHVKIDTGMGRLGVTHENAVADTVCIAGMTGIHLEGLLSHFSEADLSDTSYAAYQLQLFNDIKNKITAQIGRPVISHIANSAAILTMKGALLDAVRPGLMLYGHSPFSEGYGLVPVMKIKTRILALRNLPSGTPISYGRTFITERKSRIAVIPLGYADGFNRLFSNNADVLVRGQLAPVVGRVCMDLTMIDVTDIEEVSEADEVVVMGQQGNKTITASQLSSRINTIPYEVLTSLGNRANKVYIH